MVIEQGVEATQKKPVKKKKNVWGRPTVMTDETVKKLLDGFTMGMTDIEACVYADISKPTLYEYCNKNPKFTDQKEALKESTKVHAKVNIYNSIKDDKDVNDSKWYLERKSKDEFSTKEIIAQTTKQINYTQEEWDNMDDETLDKIINSEK